MQKRSLTLFDLAPGKVLLDRWRIVGTNRTGGMAATFAVQDVDGRACELQVYSTVLFEKRADADEFAAAMARWLPVSDPHVLRAVAVDRHEDGSVLYATDLPPGRPLRELREEGRAWEPAKVVELGLALCDGLARVHAGGLVHGDVKPHTVHVAGDGRAVLVDGGVTPALWSAKHLGEKTALIGTPFYAPLEQFGGESPDVQSDLYNTATLLYELACGVLPWRGKSFLEVFQSKLEKRPPAMNVRAPKCEVPRQLEQAIARGLMADKRDRWQTAAEFRAALAAADLEA